MANDNNVSVDEFLSKRKDFVKSGDTLVKAAVNPPTSWDAEARTARFVMSAEVEDRDKDIVVQAGLDMTEFLKNPVAPFSHKSGDFPVGQWKDVERKDTGRPKRTEGTLSLVPKGQDGVADRLAFHIGAGTIRACSIGFIPKTIRRREQSQPSDGYTYPGYMIEQAELIECSPCSIPANPAALAKSAAEGDTIARDLLEEVLDNWVKNPVNGLLIPRADFEKAYKEAAGDKSVVIISGKTFAITEVKAPEPPKPEEAETGLLKRLEDGFAKLFSRFEPPAPKPADPEHLKTAKQRAEDLEKRIAPKIAA